MDNIPCATTKPRIRLTTRVTVLLGLNARHGGHVWRCRFMWVVGFGRMAAYSALLHGVYRDLPRTRSSSRPPSART
jgi:hypothetical protein